MYDSFSALKSACNTHDERIGIIFSGSQQLPTATTCPSPLFRDGEPLQLRIWAAALKLIDLTCAEQVHRVMPTRRASHAHAVQAIAAYTAQGLFFWAQRELLKTHP